MQTYKNISINNFEVASKQETLKIQYLIRKFINHLMYDGKKEKAEKIFLNTLKILKLKEDKDGILIFLKALEKCKPLVDIRSVRRGGASYQIPVPLKEKRSISLGIKWLIDSARKKKGHNFSESLSQTLIDASKNIGDCIKKRDSFHLIALKNRSFTHFRWF